MKKHEGVLVSALYRKDGLVLSEITVRDQETNEERRVRLQPERLDEALPLGQIVKYYERKGRFGIRNNI